MRRSLLGRDHTRPHETTTRHIEEIAEKSRHAGVQVAFQEYAAAREILDPWLPVPTGGAVE